MCDDSNDKVIDFSKKSNIVDGNQQKSFVKEFQYVKLTKDDNGNTFKEEALLDMVVQFCQIGKEGYLHHTFMSAEENAFDVLDIEYGEKVDDVYKRFNEKWGRKDGE